MHFGAGRHLQDRRLDLDEALGREPSAQRGLEARARLKVRQAAGESVGAPVGHAGPSHATFAPCRVPRMTPKQIDRYCASLPAATRTVQWEGVVVFKVGGKMFCLIAPRESFHRPHLVQVGARAYDALSRSPGFRPAPYLARAKWVSVDDPKALTDREMKAYVSRAHAVIAAALSKKKQKELGLLDKAIMRGPRPHRGAHEHERQRSGAVPAMTFCSTPRAPAPGRALPGCRG